MVIKILTLTTFLIWVIYWQKEAIIAHKKNPLTKKPSFLYAWIGRISLNLFFLLAIFEMFWQPFYPLPNKLLEGALIVGFVMVIIGFIIAIAARRELSTNWASGWEYQIKQKHTLITTGIYQYIRHPIYLAVAFFLIGMQLTAGSWLFLPIMSAFLAAYFQGKREEKILLAHFGEEYRKYMKRTRMLIPFVL